MKRVLATAGKILLALVVLILVLGLVVAGLRAVNAKRYPFAAAGDGQSEMDKASYEASTSIEPIEGDYLNGFHFRPDTKLHSGVVVTYGGSEGSPDYGRAKELADEGYEVLSLFFFGQPNQVPTLANVPLEQFDEVVAYVEENVADPKPLTVVGTSKGAEFAELLAAHGFPVDNVVAFAPAHYSYSGLDFTGGQDFPSFTLRGGAVPYATFRDANFGTGLRSMWDAVTGYPVSYRDTYVQAAGKAPEGARIDLSGFAGNVVLFGGADDRMWQSDTAADSLAAQNPRIEAHVYPRAGHAFFPDASELPNGWQEMLGGTVEGNRDAYEQSHAIFWERLAEWHAAPVTPSASDSAAPAR